MRILTPEESEHLSQCSTGLNQIAQGIHDIEYVFELLKESPHPDLFWQALYTMVVQSHPTREEAVQAIEETGLKPTFTPCVLLVKDNTPEKNVGKICSLPEYEHRKALILLMKVFQIADKRRRETECKEGCSHWWHQDLRSLESG